MSESKPDAGLPEVPQRPDRGKPKIRGVELQLAQATAMMSRRLFDHKTVEEIAEEFGVERSTVHRRLKLAKKVGVPEEARNIFINDFLPAAMAVVQEGLKSDNEKIRTGLAWKLIDGLKALDPPEDETLARKMGAGDGDDFEVWRERIKVTRNKIVDAGQQVAGARRADPAPVPEVIDITPVAVEASPAPGDAPEGGGQPEAVPLREGESDGPAHPAAQDSEGAGEGGS